ncbi:hypothetical protein B0H11DRAFT_1031544 [Mycena galericulata]|nr:hypothetical protein B0H11DRAFT_1031544 [Mycena galericulata]
MAASATLPAIPFDISLITGPTMVGICLNWGFMGVTIVQLYIYYSNFPADSKTIKALVYSLGILDLVQTGLVTADAFHWFVYGFGNMDRLNDTFLNSWDVPLLDSVISLVVQVFYCWRILALRKSYLFPVLITMVSIVQCSAGVVTAVKAHQLGKLSLISTEVVEQTIWLVGSAVADVAIAIVLSWTLLRVRTVAHLPTQGVIMRIVHMIVETNALTAGVAVVGLILFLAVPKHSTLVVPPTAIMGKLYTNCLIAVFNNRAVDRQTMSNQAPLSGSVSGNAAVFRIPQNGVHISHSLKVHIDRTESSVELSNLNKLGTVHGMSHV